MARKNKKRCPEKSRKKSNKIGKNFLFLIGGVILAIVIFLFLAGRMPFTGAGSKVGKSFSVQGGETRPVLDPSLFTGMARAAYAAAKEYPEVLDQVFCYCTCDEPPFNHKSLLSCFTDNHGKG